MNRKRRIHTRSVFPGVDAEGRRGAERTVGRVPTPSVVNKVELVE